MTVAENKCWKSKLTDRGLVVVNRETGRRLGEKDLDRNKLVDLVEEMLGDRIGEQPILDMIEKFELLKDILRESSDYIKERTMEKIQETIDEILVILDEAVEWTP